MISRAHSNSDAMCFAHIHHNLLDGLDQFGLTQNHLAVKCMVLEAHCFCLFFVLKGSCVWIANGFNQRVSKCCLLKIWWCKRKRIISESSNHGNWMELSVWDRRDHRMPAPVIGVSLRSNRFWEKRPTVVYLRESEEPQTAQLTGAKS